jgi:N-terminal domain of toast_rack, DUF2154
MQRFVWIGLWLTAPLLAQVSSYEMQEAQSVVPLKGATEASVLLDISRGDLVVSSGTEYLMRGVFNFAATGRKPDVSYRQDNGNVNLYVSSRADEGDWRVFLSKQIPIEVAVNGGEGLTRLAFGDLKIRSLTIDKDGGPIEVQIDGHHPDLEMINVGQGPGPISLWLPGSYANLQQILTWSNDSNVELAFGGQFPALKEIEVEVLGGRAQVDLSGRYTVLEDVRIYGHGDVKATLSGVFESDILVEMPMKSGQLELELPTGIGVIVSVKSGSGGVESELAEQKSEKTPPKLGWLRGIWDKRQGERIFVNSAYGTTSTMMRVEITTQDGSVTLNEVKS